MERRIRFKTIMKKYSVYEKALIVFYALAAFILLLYSYTQVDLGLTLSQISIWQVIQKNFQYIGYFMRPLSTGLYIGILCFYCLLYGILLYGIQRGCVTARALWKMIVLTLVILIFSYPAFSYDFFNYMFTAKTVLIYHKNPYTVTPLQFAGVDPWLGFMHWTHNASAYSPLWIAMTLFPYLLGFGYFLLIMWNIKILIAAGYILAAWSIGKILTSDGEKNAARGIALFALNPLVVIESLVSAHNDIVMMGIALYSIVIFLERKKFLSWVALAVSAGLKTMTVFLIPSYLFRWNKKLALAGMMTGLILVCFQREILPWYFLWIMPFVALLPKSMFPVIISFGASLGLLLRYAPYLYFGHWNDPVPVMKAWLTAIPVICAAFVVGLPYLLKFMKKRSVF